MKNQALNGTMLFSTRSSAMISCKEGTPIGFYPMQPGN